MGFFPKRTRLPFLLALLISLSNLACGDDVSGPAGALAPLVGAWKASTLVMTNQANPDMEVDILEQGASFSLSILSTGKYSASLAAFGGTNTELGRVEVEGNQITLTPTSPAGPPQISTWSFQGDRLVLDGPSEFDFNQDGNPEPSFSHIELDPLSN